MVMYMISWTSLHIDISLGENIIRYTYQGMHDFLVIRVINRVKLQFVHYILQSIHYVLYNLLLHLSIYIFRYYKYKRAGLRQIQTSRCIANCLVSFSKRGSLSSASFNAYSHISMPTVNENKSTNKTRFDLIISIVSIKNDFVEWLR